MLWNIFSTGTDSYMTQNHSLLSMSHSVLQLSLLNVLFFAAKTNENDTSHATILSVAIPVAVLVVIILLVAGIFIFIKYKR